MSLSTRRHPIKLATLAILALACVVGLSSGATAQASEPDYQAPGNWLLPWQSGESYRVTWGPQDHWAASKATGIAYDFGLPKGVPIYAPVDATARFARDDRPLSTTLGNYVDLQTDDGWLIRMAHLRDERIETRRVIAGELVGHAGASGVTVSHLHVELLVWQDGSWQRPNPARLTQLFGHSVDMLGPGAIVANRGCTGMLVADDDVHPLSSPIRLGGSTLMLLPLRNEGDRSLNIAELQLMLTSPIGETAFVDAQGLWRFPARSLHTVAILVKPDLAGLWEIQGIRYATTEQACDITLSGQLLVEPLPITLSSLSFTPPTTIGAPLEIDLALQHAGLEPIAAEDLLVWGTNPSGGQWQATLGEPIDLDSGQERHLQIRNGPVYDQIGPWRMGGVALVQGGKSYRFALHGAEIRVSGPQLSIDTLELFSTATRTLILARVTNSGNRVAQQLPLEVWGWQDAIGDKTTIARASVSFLEPGQSTMLRLEVTDVTGQAPWRLAGAGYWLDDNYVAMPLPTVPYTAPYQTMSDTSE